MGTAGMHNDRLWPVGGSIDAGLQLKLLAQNVS